MGNKSGKPKFGKSKSSTHKNTLPPQTLPKPTLPPPPPPLSKDLAQLVTNHKENLETLMNEELFLEKKSFVMKPTNPKINSNTVPISIYFNANDKNITLKKSIITEVTQKIIDIGYTQFDNGIEFYCFDHSESVTLFRDIDGTPKIKIILADCSFPDALMDSNIYTYAGSKYTSTNTGIAKLNISSPKEFFRYIVTHELGHALQYLALDDSVGARLFNKNLTAESEIAGQVSKYAQQNKTEFVAEVFAGRMHGMVYNQEILRLYNNLGGPPLEFSTPPLRKKFLVAPLQKGQYQQRVIDGETHLPFLDNLNEITDANVNFRPRRGSFPFRDADALPLPNFEPHIDFQKAAEHNWDAFYYHKQPIKNKTIQQKTLQDSIQRNLLKEDFPLSGPPKLARAVSVPNIVSNRAPSPTPPKNKLKF